MVGKVGEAAAEFAANRGPAIMASGDTKVLTFELETATVDTVTVDYYYTVTAADVEAGKIVNKASIVGILVLAVGQSQRLRSIAANLEVIRQLYTSGLHRTAVSHGDGPVDGAVGLHGGGHSAHTVPIGRAGDAADDLLHGQLVAAGGSLDLRLHGIDTRLFAVEPRLDGRLVDDLPGLHVSGGHGGDRDWGCDVCRSVDGDHPQSQSNEGR